MRSIALIRLGETQWWPYIIRYIMLLAEWENTKRMFLIIVSNIITTGDNDDDPCLDLVEVIHLSKTSW